MDEHWILLTPCVSAGKTFYAANCNGVCELTPAVEDDFGDMKVKAPKPGVLECVAPGWFAFGLTDGVTMFREKPSLQSTDLIQQALGAVPRIDQKTVRGTLEGVLRWMTWRTVEWINSSSKPDERMDPRVMTLTVMEGVQGALDEALL